MANFCSSVRQLGLKVFSVLFNPKTVCLRSVVTQPLESKWQSESCFGTHLTIFFRTFRFCCSQVCNLGRLLVPLWKARNIYDIQLWTFAYLRLLNKPYENQVTLIGQNPHLKCCQPLKILTPFKMGVDL